MSLTDRGCVKLANLSYSKIMLGESIYFWHWGILDSDGSDWFDHQRDTSTQKISLKGVQSSVSMSTSHLRVWRVGGQYSNKHHTLPFAARKASLAPFFKVWSADCWQMECLVFWFLSNGCELSFGQGHPLAQESITKTEYAYLQDQIGSFYIHWLYQFWMFF